MTTKNVPKLFCDHFLLVFFGYIILAIPIRESIPRARQRQLDPFVICYGFLCFQTVPWVYSRHGHCGAGGGKNFIRAAAGTIPVGLLFWPRSHSSNLTETRSSFIKNNFVEIMEWVGYLLIAWVFTTRKLWKNSHCVKSTKLGKRRDLVPPEMH